MKIDIYVTKEEYKKLKDNGNTDHLLLAYDNEILLGRVEVNPVLAAGSNTVILGGELNDKVSFLEVPTQEWLNSNL